MVLLNFMWAFIKITAVKGRDLIFLGLVIGRLGPMWHLHIIGHFWCKNQKRVQRVLDTSNAIFIMLMI